MSLFQTETIELVPEYNTGTNAEVNDEIETIKCAYENVTVTGKQSHRKVTIPLVSETNSNKRLRLEIGIVPGYPYTPPHVVVHIPALKENEKCAFTKEERERMKREVNDNVELCRTNQIPCMMQVASVVSSFLDSLYETKQKVPKKKSESAVTSSPTVTPSSTPVPMKAKDALRLSILTLHLLRKCCQMKERESKEEANSSFECLASYFLKDLEVFPQGTQSCIPWKREVFSRAFGKEIEETSMHTSERRELKKWVWESDEHATKLQGGTEGRYKNEFLQQRLLGKGGFAPVYVCRKIIDGRLYAVKKIPVNEKESEKVIREVQTLATFNHTNIVRYYDAWVEDGCDEELLQFIEDEDDEEEEDEEKGDADNAKHVKHIHVESSLTDESSADSDSMNSMFSSDEENDESSSEKEDGVDKMISTSRQFKTLYVQMELCSARSLRHLIDESDGPNNDGLLNSKQGETIAATILRQLLTVISYTHCENIVHRDLKPDNVLFEIEKNANSGDVGTIRVADFGLARTVTGVKRNMSTAELESTLSPTSEVTLQAAQNNMTGNCGSVLYCAPEQENSMQYDLKVDEFSIGMIALEMWLTIAGKGFRDRFNIMKDVWRTGKLPSWFCKWNPPMADVIGKLVEINPQKRKTCEEVLATAELPGDPIEITQTLGTVDRYGERIAGRIVQRIQKGCIQKRKPPPELREEARLIASTFVTEVTEAVHLIGSLHGSIPVELSGLLIPMNEALIDLGVNAMVDSGGRCFGSFALPHWSTATFLGMNEMPPTENYYLVYNNKSPFAVFTTPLSKENVINERLLEPLLSLYHLLSLFDVTERIEIVISHAQWLNAVFPVEIGNRPPPAKLTSQKHTITVTDQIGSAISEISETLSEHASFAVSHEQDDFIRRYVTYAFEILQFFNALSPFVSIVLNPALLPSPTVVERAVLKNGIIFECRNAHSVPIAFGCYLDDFVQKLTVTNTSASAFCVNVDIKQLPSLAKHIKSIAKSDIQLNGVAVRRHEQYSYAALLDVVGAAVALWKGNIRACIRVDHDFHLMAKALKVKNIRWVLSDGKRLVGVSSQSNKTGSKDEIPLDSLRSAIRKLGVESTGTSSLASNAEVIFLACPHDNSVSDDARRVYGTIMETLPVPILVSNAPIEEIRSSLYALEDALVEKSKPSAPHPLEDWICAHADSHSIIPVYSSVSKLLVFYVNYKQIRTQKKSSRGNNNNNATKKK